MPWAREKEGRGNSKMKQIANLRVFEGCANNPMQLFTRLK